jgi:cytoskeletal protein RodZ
MSTAPQPRIRRRPGWLAVIGTSAAIFLVVLALLWARVSAGEDPVLGAQASATQVTTTSPDTRSSDSTSSDTTSADATDDTTSSASSSSDVPATHAS